MDKTSAKKADAVKQLVLQEKLKEKESAEEDVGSPKDRQSFLKTFNTARRGRQCSIHTCSYAQDCAKVQQPV